MKSRYSYLLNNLNSFLNTYSITTTCDVFEETLLKAANIETQPTLCKFGPESDAQLYFKIRGISEEESDTFLKFLKETTGDENVSKKYIPLESNEVAISESSSTTSSSSSDSSSDTSSDDDIFSSTDYDDVYHFIVDQNKANITLLPIFEETFHTISQEKMQKYGEECEDTLSIYLKEIQALEKKASKRWKDLKSGINTILYPLSISCGPTDIFEETILKMAGIKNPPKKCQFDSEDDLGSLSIMVSGINEEDTTKFLNFFTETLEDDCAFTRFSKNAIWLSSEEALDAQEFVVNMKNVLKNLLPLFESEIIKINKYTPEVLDSYKKLSENDTGVLSYKLPKLFEEIMTQTAELKSMPVSKAIHDELKTIIDLMLNQSLEKLEYVRENPKYKVPTKYDEINIKNASLLLDKVSEEYTELKDNKTIKALQKNLAEYTSIHKLGLFKKKQNSSSDESSHDLTNSDEDSDDLVRVTGCKQM